MKKNKTDAGMCVPIKKRVIINIEGCISEYDSILGVLKAMDFNEEHIFTSTSGYIYNEGPLTVYKKDKYSKVSSDVYYIKYKNE